jgi:Tfp pilus assembly protein PilF
MPRVFALFIAILTCATVTQGSVRIVVGTGAGKMLVMKLCSDAGHQLNNGDAEGAKRNVDRALQIDPKLWPASDIWHYFSSASQFALRNTVRSLCTEIRRNAHCIALTHKTCV